MSAVKRQFFELLMQQPGNYASVPRDAVVLPSAHPTASPQPPRHVFILTMNGKPLSVYASEATAQRDLTVMREGDVRDGYQSTYAVKPMRVDYTTP
jgi:hypothetical protein